jgi:hypothetical protein
VRDADEAAIAQVPGFTLASARKLKAALAATDAVTPAGGAAEPGIQAAEGAGEGGNEIDGAEDEGPDDESTLTS